MTQDLHLNDALNTPIAALEHEVAALKRACGLAPPGHFYSPLISLADHEDIRARLYGSALPAEIPGVALNAEEQLATLRQMAPLIQGLNFPVDRADGHRYFFNNDMFSYADALSLAGMMALHRPKRIIEVGCGYSSAVMLDTMERCALGPIDLLFIDPSMEALRSLTSADEFAHLATMANRVQDVPVDVFSRLQANDILFIDSSHVSKCGSDVNHLVFEVLPRLQPGVLVHFHDIFYPFEYPFGWVAEGRHWNELYLIRALLQFSSRYTIELFNSYLGAVHREAVAAELPLALKNPGGSLWLRTR